MIKKFILGLLFCGIWNPLYAKEITILYTGETHAMLYPCSCPKEPDGGVSRRATLLKELKKNNPDILLLDSGGFFAGGLMDEYTQNTSLDIERTKVNVKAMETMKYDAVNIGDDEFNFGRGFLQSRIDNTKMPFLSCNLDLEKALPYIIKDIRGVKIGITGVSGLFAAQKAEGLKFEEPKIAVKKTIEELKAKHADIIVVLSHQGESEDINLIRDVAGIDILIIGHNRSQQETLTKTGETLLLRPSWQGRRLGKLSLTVENNKIINYKAEELRLSDKFSEDKEVLSILPACFSDVNCRKDGSSGACRNPGSLKAGCVFTQAAKIPLTIITAKDCRVCNTDQAVNYLKKQFPGITVSYLYYPDKEAGRLIKDYGIKILPAYLLGKEIEKEKGFSDDFMKNLEVKGGFYMLKPQVSGMTYFLERKMTKGKLDLFIGLYEPYAKGLLELIKEYNPVIHFLAVERQGGLPAGQAGFDASKGNLEVEEYLRAVCVQKYYPRHFWDYIGCRSANINSSWWEDCLPAGQAGSAKFDANKIKACSRSPEGTQLLRENISANKEMQVMFGPVYLMDNQEAFTTQGVPKKEELRKILK